VRSKDDEVEDVVLDIPLASGVLGEKECLGVGHGVVAIINLIK